MGKLIEGVWDCQYCDSKKIRGSIRVCPVCGRQRDNNIKFYIDNPHNYVNDEEAKKINRNPDWICSYCDALNSDDLNNCHICGASREDSEQNYFERQAEIAARRAERDRMLAAASGEINEESQTAQNDSDPMVGNSASSTYSENLYDDVRDYDSRSNLSDHNAEECCDYNSESLRRRSNRWQWGNILKIGAGVLAALMLILGMIWMFSPKIKEVTVSDFSWERSIDVEEYVTVERSDWYLPADGQLLYTNQEIKGYEQVLDHYETKTRTYTEQVLDHYETYVSGYRDLGNGYFEEIESQRPVYRTETKTETYQEPVYRNEPIYATKYYYEIDVWQHAFYSTSSGEDKDPYWKEVELKDLQREGGRSEAYYITVINKKDETDKYQFDFDTWNGLEPGDVITIKTTIFGDAELVVDDEVIAKTESTR